MTESVNEPLIGVYPGTFDPVTNGHMDIIQRATRMVDRLIVAVAVNEGKGPLFGIEERIDLVEAEISELGRPNGCEIFVRPFSNLLMDFVVSVNADVIVRGLRAVSDFEYEFQMAGMNVRLNPEVETVFLMASERHQLIASRLVKEVARLGGDVSQFVSPRIEAALRDHYGE